MPRPRYTSADRQPTWTAKAIGALKAADDFLNFQQLMTLTGANRDQLSAALHHLKTRAKAVDCLESEGHLWWFLTGEDARGRVVEERVPEPKGNRGARKKPGPKPKGKTEE